MPNQQKPIHPIAAAGFGFLTAGLLAWLWTGEWRWALTGLAILIASAVAAAAAERRRP